MRAPEFRRLDHRSTVSFTYLRHDAIPPAPDRMTVAQQIQAFIKSQFQADIAPTDSLLDSGLVDSVGIFELVGFLEAQYGLKVADEEIVPENFETVSHVETFVERQRGVLGA